MEHSKNVVNFRPGDFIITPARASPIVSMCEHKGHLYVAKSEGVFRWNELQHEFEQLQFVVS